MRSIATVLLLFVLGSSAFCLGYLTHRNEWIPLALRNRLNATVDAVAAPQRDARPPGEWYPHVTRAVSPDSGALSPETRDQLAAIGYLQGYTEAPGDRSVTVHDVTRAQPGLNLYSSGHKPEALLVDMTGAVVHTWSYDFARLWPDYQPPPYYRETGSMYWRRVFPYPNGDLLAIHQGIGLIKLDRESNVVWKRAGGFHHDFDIDDAGNIYVLYRTQEALPDDPAEGFLMEPFVSVLDAHGNEQRRVSLLKCFENSAYAPLLEWVKPTGDLFHTNTIQVFDGSQAHRSPLFEHGKILISIWSLDTAAIVDLDRETVDWAVTGRWRRQHEPMILDNGNMLVFDNRGNRGRSRIVEMDPLTLETVWTYQGEDPDDFHSEWCGAVQRLANGNTLITETNNGRAFEVTPSGDIVWEFINPNQVEQEGTTLIASLWETIRLPMDYGADWLAASSDG